MNFHLHLDTETVRHLRPSEPTCVGPEVSVGEVLRRLRESRRGSILICEDGKLAGIFTERDALKLLAAEADLELPIKTVMTTNPACLSVDDTVGAAIQKMSIGGYRRLPVVDSDGSPVGVIKVGKILRYLVEHFPRIVYTLPPKPSQVSKQREGA